MFSYPIFKCIGYHDSSGEMLVVTPTIRLTLHDHQVLDYIGILFFISYMHYLVISLCLFLLYELVELISYMICDF